MSEFYKRNKSFILKNYKYLGMKEKITFCLSRTFMTVLIVQLIYDLNNWADSENKESSLANLVIFSAIIICYVVSKTNNKKQQENKLDAVSKYVKNPGININTVEALIGEIERYNKKMRTFATWIAGLSATFIILLATLAYNYFIKIFDVVLRVIPENELLNTLESLNHSGSIMVLDSNYIDLGGALLIIFIILILIIYNIFTIFTFIKEQILLFLFDVKYEIISCSNQENKIEDVSMTENKFGEVNR